MNTGGDNWTDEELPRDYKVGTEPVRIKFKSTTHGVFGLKWLEYENTITCNTLPSFKSLDILERK